MAEPGTSPSRYAGIDSDTARPNFYNFYNCKSSVSGRSPPALPRLMVVVVAAGALANVAVRCRWLQTCML